VQKDQILEKNNDHVRQAAERALLKTRKNIQDMSIENVNELVHELQVHHIELNMQNEALVSAQEELEKLQQKYYNLYDRAPIGYITVNKDNTICEANLMAGTLLGCSRAQLIGKKFTEFIQSESQDAYYLHYRRVFLSDGQQICDLHLKNNAYVQLNSSSNKTDECRITISNLKPIECSQGYAL
jgi:PAS domain-containing protein